MITRKLYIFALFAAFMGVFTACSKTSGSGLVAVSGTTLAEKLQWLDTNAASNTSYLLEVKNTREELAPRNLAYFGTNITIQIKSSGREKVISLSGNGSLFTISNGVTLVLNNVTVTGTNANNNPLIQINSGGSLEINHGTKISGNNGNGVYNYGGNFTMNGGEIFGNANGGVRNDVIYTIIDDMYLTIDGIFTMNGGKITGNTSASSSSSGGVFNNGTFTMNGGEISGNTGGGVYNDGTFIVNGGKISVNTSSSFYGGGVHNGVIYTMVDGVYKAVKGNFTMNGGEISGNTGSFGGGVFNHGVFTMEDGKISGNTAFFYGGGTDNNGTFTMKGGIISGNNTFFYGGGVSNRVDYTYTYDGYEPDRIFIMIGGEISGNTASYGGGGVYVGNEMLFNKNGGIITGYSEGDNNSNIIKDDFGNVQKSQGHSVYAYNSNSNYIRYKDTPSGQTDVLLYNGKTDPPVWSGIWDN